jgi:hypothetical protein
VNYVINGLMCFGGIVVGALVVTFSLRNMFRNFL